MNRYILVLAVGVIFATFVSYSRAEETTTPFSLENIVKNIKESEAAKAVQNSFKNLNVDDLTKKAKEIQEAVRPYMEKIQPNFNASVLVDNFKKGFAPILEAFNVTTPAN